MPTIRRIGNSLGVLLPRGALAAAGFQIGDPVRVVATSDGEIRLTRPTLPPIPPPTPSPEPK